MLIATPSKVIKYISYGWRGKHHDFSVLKKEFPPQSPWFNNFTLKVDLGYLGIVKEYACQAISIPYKKTKQQSLTATQKQENSQLAAERIVVEHSIAGLKRYRVLSDRLRIHDVDLYNNILGVCAGLWNFNLCN